MIDVPLRLYFVADALVLLLDAATLVEEESCPSAMPTGARALPGLLGITGRARVSTRSYRTGVEDYGRPGPLGPASG